jgi:hypothetical protein
LNWSVRDVGHGIDRQLQQGVNARDRKRAAMNAMTSIRLSREKSTNLRIMRLILSAHSMRVATAELRTSQLGLQEKMRPA